MVALTTIILQSNTVEVNTLNKRRVIVSMFLMLWVLYWSINFLQILADGGMTVHEQASDSFSSWTPTVSIVHSCFENDSISTPCSITFQFLSLLRIQHKKAFVRIMQQLPFWLSAVLPGFFFSIQARFFRQFPGSKDKSGLVSVVSEER